jgi:hypothetical protein
MLPAMATKTASGTRKKTGPRQLTSPGSSVRSTPIGDYGFLSDGEVSALLSPNGAIEWMCVPRFDSRPRIRPRCATCPAPW